MDNDIRRLWDAIAGIQSRLGKQLQGRHVSAAAPSDGDVFKWNATTKKLEPKGSAMLRKTARETVNNSTTLQDDDHLLFALAANEIWAFELFLISNGPAAGDIKFAFTVPGGAMLMWEGIGLEATAAAHADLGIHPLMTVSGTAQAFGELGGANWVLTRIFGTVVNGATPGDLQLQWAQNGADGTDTHLEANSWLKAEQI